MNFKEIMETEAQKINFEIASFFNDYLVIRVDPFVLQFYSSLKRFILSGGKRLRPVVLIQAYKGLEKKLNLEIYNVALCVEFLHNASLVHDDIIDHDETRRGEPSFHVGYEHWFKCNFPRNVNWRDFGMSMGILGGDSLLQLGIRVIQNSNFELRLKNRAISYYIQSYEELINGVLYESFLQNLPLIEITEQDYLTMAAGKTSALFEKALLIGALLADGEEKNRESLKSLAVNLGQAFQIQDDILGIFGQEKKLGKPVFSDIREGKKTLLAVFSAEDERMESLYGKQDLTTEEGELVKKVIEETGALEKTKKIAFELSKTASENLARIPFSPDTAKFFEDLIEFVRSRIY